MTDKMQRFCDCYLANGKTNAAQAYRDAGYKANNDQTAAASAHNLLRKSEIADYLSKHSAEIEKKAKEEHENKLLTAEDLCLFWGNMMHTADKDADRLKASELYGKFLGAFTTNVNMQGTAAIVIKDDVKE